MQKIDVIIIGAGAAGLMCAIEAGKRRRSVLVLDHANKAGKKILMSGGGRCNFTNYYVSAENYISHNPHFCKSALSRYTQWDFINLVRQYKIDFHEKTAGQLFCDNKAKDILQMLLCECEASQVEIRLNTMVTLIDKINDHHFKVNTNHGELHCESLVIASGGLSIPTMGASPFGYKIAEQFNIKLWPLRAGLVPFTLQTTDKEKLLPLAGIAVNSIISTNEKSFHENMLFTHRGLSGPAVLQISSYWSAGNSIKVNLLPAINILEDLKSTQKQFPIRQLKTILSEYLPKRVVEVFIDSAELEKPIHAISHQQLQLICSQFINWQPKPNGTEGYRTAEVTLGGVDCNAISSQTMQVNQVTGLYFIGEVLDVTGWLGGFNFQWAWSSGWAAGQVV